MNKKLIILAGCSGSGKTTLARKIREEYFRTHNDMVAICSADEYWIRPDGIYDWNPKYIKNAHQWCRSKCDMFMSMDYDLVIVDNTNLTEAERKPYIDMATKYNYSVEIQEPQTEWRYNAEECAKRNIHGVPLETCKNMIAKLQV